jgi:hypothetical protein
MTNDSGNEDVRVQFRKANGAFIELYPIWKSRSFPREQKSIYSTLT